MMHYKDESGCRSQNGTGAGTGTNGLIRHCGKTSLPHEMWSPKDEIALKCSPSST